LRKVGTVLTSAAPAWNVTPEQQTTQWLRNGQDIPGATSATYVVQPEDVDKATPAGSTAPPPGSPPGPVPGPAVPGVLGDAPVAGPRPAPAGSGLVGTVLTAPAATWSPATVTESWQWLLDGAPIVGENAATYTVRAADAGRRLSVRVTALMSGYRPGS